MSKIQNLELANHLRCFKKWEKLVETVNEEDED